MRTHLEMAQGLRYKLIMMGVRIESPIYIYGDNMSVIHNTSKPESTLKKKANSVCYHHYIREAVAADECGTEETLALMKTLWILQPSPLYVEKREIT